MYGLARWYEALRADEQDRLAETYLARKLRGLAVTGSHGWLHAVSELPVNREGDHKLTNKKLD